MVESRLFYGGNVDTGGLPDGRHLEFAVLIDTTFANLFEVDDRGNKIGNRRQGMSNQGKNGLAIDVQGGI